MRERIGDTQETTVDVVQNKVREALTVFGEIPLPVIKKIDRPYQEMQGLMARVAEAQSEPKSVIMRGVNFELGDIGVTILSNRIWLNFHKGRSFTIQSGEAFEGDREYREWRGKVFKYRLYCSIDEGGIHKEDIFEVSLFKDGALEYEQHKEELISNQPLGPGKIVREMQTSTFRWERNNVA